MPPCKHFRLDELVHPEILKSHGKQAWCLLDPRMLRVLDWFRDYLGLIVINDYAGGGCFKNSGLRTTFGSPGSAHRFGCGFDIKVKDREPPEVHHFIKNNERELYRIGLRRVEHVSATPTWTHIDSKPAPLHTSPGTIYFFHP